MKLVATPALVLRDEGGSVTLRRGNRTVSLADPRLGQACVAILSAFAAPGREMEAGLASFGAQARTALDGLIGQMTSAGFLVPADTDLADPVGTFWNDYGRSPQAIDDAARKLDVTLVGRNRLSARIADSLTAAGVRIARRIDDPALRGPGSEGMDGDAWHPADGFALPADAPLRLVVAATDIGAETCLRPWNEMCVAAEAHFLPVSIKDNKITVGPYVRPFEGACFECARGRVNANAMTPDRADEARRPERPDAFGWHPILLDTGAALVAAEVLRQAFGALPPIRADLIAADPLGAGTVARYGVLRLPRCPVCSPIRRHTAPMVVDSEDRNRELIEAFK